MLITFGASINIKDDAGTSLLQNYTDKYNSVGFNDFKSDYKTGLKDIIEVLLSYGIDINISDDNDENALTSIIRSPYCDYSYEIFNLLLLYGADCTVKNINNMTTIMIAAQNKNCNTIDFIKKLINCGADLFAKDNKGNNALFYAAETEDIE